jgi:hypothetical protein
VHSINMILKFKNLTDAFFEMAPEVTGLKLLGRS